MKTDASPKKGNRRKSAFAEEEEGYMFVEEGFRIRFANGETIDFYADSAEEKDGWMKVLSEVVRKDTSKPRTWTDIVMAKRAAEAAKAAKEQQAQQAQRAQQAQQIQRVQQAQQAQRAHQAQHRAGPGSAKQAPMRSAPPTPAKNFAYPSQGPRTPEKNPRRSDAGHRRSDIAQRRDAAKTRSMIF